MAWDIYGNHLRPGYCEVHPHVPEEYPCMLCRIRDREEQENRFRGMQQEREYFKAMEEQHNHEMAMQKSPYYRFLYWLKDIVAKELDRILNKVKSNHL